MIRSTLLVILILISVTLKMQAAVIHTDVVPDTLVAGSFGSYFLDVNNDGDEDYGIWLISAGAGITVLPLDSNEVHGQFSGPSFHPDALNAGVMIDSNLLEWENGGGGHLELAPGGSGAWNGVVDKFLGLRFFVSGMEYYGWVMLEISSGGTQYIVKEYAYEDVSGEGIIAGQAGVSAPKATMLTATDEGNNTNSGDIRLTFQKGSDESLISLYKAFIVPSSLSASFNLGDAQTALPGNFLELTPTGANIDTLLPDNIPTFQGLPLELHISYTMFVMSVADGSMATSNALSDSSNSFMLNTYTDTAKNILANDISDSGNATDLEVTFNRADNEAGIEAYRLFAVPESEVSTFDETEASALGSGFYLSFDPATSPSADPLTVTYDTTIADKNGAAIVEDKPYSVCILSVADDSHANESRLSGCSDPVTLSTTVNSLIGTVSKEPIVYQQGDQLIIRNADAIPEQTSIYNTSGQKIYESKSADPKMTISFENQPKGMYIVVISGNNRNFTMKFLYR